MSIKDITIRVIFGCFLVMIGLTMTQLNKFYVKKEL